MIQQRHQPIALAVLFVLALAPIIFGMLDGHPYPVGPFGGGGGSAFEQSSVPVPFNPLVDGIIGWMVGKAADYVVANYNAPSGCGGWQNECPAGAFGGGGGGTW